MNVKNAIYETLGEPLTGRGNLSWFDGNTTINGLRMIGGEVLVNGTNVSIKGLAREQSVLGIFPLKQNQTYSELDFSGKGNVVDLALQSNNLNTTYTNIESGSSNIIVGAETGTDNRNRGYAKITQKLNFNLIDEADASSDTVKIFCIDTDNGHRKNLNSIDDTGDKTYFTQTSSGISDVLDVVTTIVSVEGTNPRGTDNVAPYDKDVRSLSGVLGEDVFKFQLLGYKYAYKEISVACNKSHLIETKDKVFNDSNITETDKTIVDAYTELDTAKKAYDRMKSWKVENETNMSLDGASVFPIGRTGDKLTSSKSIIIDKTASEVFAYDGTTVTIKADVFIGDIELSSRTVTLSNGATTTGSIIDDNGDSFLSFSGIESWQLFNTQSDRDNNTNEVANGTESYRFNFTSTATYYLRVVSTGTTFLTEQEVTAKGETNVSLSSNALLSTVITKIDELNNVSVADVWGHPNRTLNGDIIE
jgi:hypothetical protein